MILPLTVTYPPIYTPLIHRVAGISGHAERRSVMLKQVELQGKRFEFCSIDGGRTWSSDPRALVAYKRRRERAGADLRKSFEHIVDEVAEPEPDSICEVNVQSGVK